MRLLLVLLVEGEIAHNLAGTVAALVVDLKTVTELWEDVLEV